MDDDKKKLGYRPNIEYEEDYYSEGAIKPIKNGINYISFLIKAANNFLFLAKKGKNILNEFKK